MEDSNKRKSNFEQRASTIGKWKYDGDFGE